MGYSKWSDDAFSHLKTGYTKKSTAAIFTSKATTRDMSPNGVTFRESRDSADHPNSVPTIFMLDVTGSMGRIPEVLVREKLGALMSTIIAHGVADPQLLFGAIGDHQCDKSPLQISQFESGTTEIDKWLTSIHLEGGGGGQIKESYLLAWLFAARHTTHDSFEKRRRKGFLFTVGDEWTWESVDADTLKSLMGYTEASPIEMHQILEEAKRTYEVFHIHINEGSYRDDPAVLEPWKELLGERLIKLDDYQAIAETVATTVALFHGKSLATITAGFDKRIASSVTTALATVSTGITTFSDKGTIKL